MGERRPTMFSHIVQVGSAETLEFIFAFKLRIVTGDEVEAPAAQLSRIVQL